MALGRDRSLRGGKTGVGGNVLDGGYNYVLIPGWLVIQKDNYRKSIYTRDDKKQMILIVIHKMQ